MISGSPHDLSVALGELRPNGKIIETESQVQTEDTTPRKDPSTAEKLTGTKYSVQIGVFANQENVPVMT
jgi:cell division septation protein DedD